VRILSVLGTLLLLAGCSAPPEPASGEGYVLLADKRGGALSPIQAVDPPDFVLYGDGRAIAPERDSEALRLVEYHLTPQRVRELFEEADAAELFDDEDYSLGEQVSDAGSLLIVVRTKEREHLANVVLPDPDDFGARGDAAEFGETLDPATWAESDFTEPAAPYRADRVAVTYSLEATPAANVRPREWPLPETEPIESRCVVLTGDAAAQAQRLGETVAQTTVWRHGEVTFLAWVRPLLLDEADCEASRVRQVR
jgi:hypothetical protein